MIYITHTEWPFPKDVLDAAAAVGATQIVRDVTKPEGLSPEDKPTTPQVVTMRQARLALLAASKLDEVENAISKAGQAARIEWEYATEVQRTSALTLTLTAALGMSEEEVDELFRQAAAL